MNQFEGKKSAIGGLKAPAWLVSQGVDTILDRYGPRKVVWNTTWYYQLVFKWIIRNLVIHKWRGRWFCTVDGDSVDLSTLSFQKTQLKHPSTFQPLQNLKVPIRNVDLLRVVHQLGHLQHIEERLQGFKVGGLTVVNSIWVTGKLGERCCNSCYGAVGLWKCVFCIAAI